MSRAPSAFSCRAPIRGSAPWAPLLAFSVPAVVYFATAARGLVWGDGPELAAVAASLGVAHPTGYPLFTLVGHVVCLLPWGKPALQMTLLCGVFVALATGMLQVLLARLGGGDEQAAGGRRHLWALAGAWIFAFTSAPWSHATRVEVYGLQLLLQLALGAALLGHLHAPTPGRRVVVAALWGLALGHHLLALALAPLVLWCIFFAIPGESSGARRLVRPAVAFALALTPLLYVPLRAATSPGLNFGDPSSPRRWLRTLTGGDYLESFLFVGGHQSGAFSAHAADRAHEIGRFLAEQLIPLQPARQIWTVTAFALALLAVIGLLDLGRRCRRFAAAWTLSGALYLGMLVVYDIRDISDYQLGFWGWLFPIGWHGLACTASIGVFDQARADVPGTRREALSFLLVFLLAALLLACNWPRHDRAGYRVPDHYAERLFGRLPESAVLVTDGDAATATAWYLQHAEGRRRDIEVICLRLLRADWYAAELEARGLWKGPGPRRGSPPADAVELLENHVLHRGLRRPVFAVLTRRSARALGLSVDVGEELLTAADWVEVVAAGDGVPAHLRFQVSPSIGPAALRQGRPETRRNERDEPMPIREARANGEHPDGPWAPGE